MVLSTVLVAILWPGVTQAIFLCTGCTVCRGGMGPAVATVSTINPFNTNNDLAFLRQLLPVF